MVICYCVLQKVYLKYVLYKVCLKRCIWIGFLKFSIWKYVFDISYMPFHATDVVLVSKNKGELS